MDTQSAERSVVGNKKKWTTINNNETEHVNSVTNLWWMPHITWFSGYTLGKKIHTFTVRLLPCCQNRFLLGTLMENQWRSTRKNAYVSVSSMIASLLEKRNSDAYSWTEPKTKKVPRKALHQNCYINVQRICVPFLHIHRLPKDHQTQALTCGGSASCLPPSWNTTGISAQWNNH